MLIITKAGQGLIAAQIYENTIKDIKVITFDHQDEIAQHGIAKSAIRKLELKQVLDLGFCKVTRVHTSFTTEKRPTSKCVAAGFVILLPSGESFYFGGKTRLFSIMEGVQNLYKPSTVVLQIGDDGDAMSTEEAAFACSFYFNSTKLLLPIWLSVNKEKQLRRNVEIWTCGSLQIGEMDNGNYD